MCVFEGHVRDWRQKIQRTEGKTGKVRNVDVWLQSSAICLWLINDNHNNTHLSLLQRKRTSQSNNKKGRCGAHCKYTKVYFHSRFINVYILTWNSMIMTSSWQMGEMEISRAVAERSLREHMGNVVEALIALTNWVDLTALRCMDTLDCLFPACDDPFLFTLYLFCNKGTFFKQSLPVQLTSLHLLETPTLFLIMHSRWTNAIRAIVIYYHKTKGQFFPITNSGTSLRILYTQWNVV